MGFLSGLGAVSSAIGAVGTVASTFIAAKGAKDAQKAQEKSTEAALQIAQDEAAVQQHIFDTNRDDLAVYREVGERSLFHLFQLMGELTRPFGAKEFFEGTTVTPLPAVGGSMADFKEEEASRRLGRINEGITERQELVATPGAAPGRNVGQEISRLESERARLLIDHPDLGDTSGSAGVGGLDGASTALDFSAAESVNFRDPGFDFRIAEGEKSIRRNARAFGGLSGATLKDLNTFAQNTASEEFSNAFNRSEVFNANRFNRLAAMANIGQAATAATGQFGVAQAQLSQQNSAAQGKILIEGGRATAAGEINRANVFSSGVTSLTNQSIFANTLAGGGGGVGNGKRSFAPATNQENAQFFRNV